MRFPGAESKEFFLISPHFGRKKSLLDLTFYSLRSADSDFFGRDKIFLLQEMLHTAHTHAAFVERVDVNLATFPLLNLKKSLSLSESERARDVITSYLQE